LEVKQRGLLLIAPIPFGGFVLLIMACIPGSEENNDYDRN